MSVARQESLQGLPDLLDALPAGLLSRANLNLDGFCETNADARHLYEDPRALQALLPYSFCLIPPCSSRFRRNWEAHVQQPTVNR